MVRFLSRNAHRDNKNHSKEGRKDIKKKIGSHSRKDTIDSLECNGSNSAIIKESSYGIQQIAHIHTIVLIGVMNFNPLFYRYTDN